MAPADRLVTNHLAGRTVTPSNACAAPRASSSPSHRPVLRPEVEPSVAIPTRQANNSNCCSAERGKVRGEKPTDAPVLT